MQKTFICKNCNKEKPANPKLKGKQNYCGEAKCQHARKAAWQKEKMDTDVEYKDSQHDLVDQWRTNKPAAQYMSQYRVEHPNYTKTNREKQRMLRNPKRYTKKSSDELIVKMDALTSKEPIIYIILNTSGKIVKMDALTFKEPIIYIVLNASGKIVKNGRIIDQLQQYQRNHDQIL